MMFCDRKGSMINAAFSVIRTEAIDITLMLSGHIILLIIRPYIYPHIPMRGTSIIRNPILIIRPVMFAAQVKDVLFIPFNMLERLTFK